MISTQYVAMALKIVISEGKTARQTIHHSDKGLPYCSSIYQNELIGNNFILSMTEGYHCYQNTLGERINGILKHQFHP